MNSTARLHNEGEEVLQSLKCTTNVHVISSSPQKEERQSYSWDAWKKVKINV